MDESGNLTGAKDAIKALAKERYLVVNGDRSRTSTAGAITAKKPDPGQKLARTAPAWGHRDSVTR